MYWEALSIPVWTEGGSCLTSAEVKLAICPATKAPEVARVEEGPDATVGEIQGPVKDAIGKRVIGRWKQV